MLRRLRPLFCGLVLAMFAGSGATAQAAPAARALPICITEVNYEKNWVEVFNGNDQSIDVSSYALCRGDFCKTLGELPALYDTGTAMRPETFVVVSWDPNRDADGDPTAVDGEVALFASAPFTAPGGLLDYVAFGAPQNDGSSKQDLAVAAGRWGAGEVVPAAPAGKTLSFFGTCGDVPRRGFADNWRAGEPTPGDLNLQVATARDAPDAVAGRFYLSPAYPNPFNPRTQVTLTVDRPQRVRVDVYNLLGERVATLHDGPMAAQTPHRLTFDAGDLPSGLYLIRAGGEYGTATRRVALLK